MSLPSTNNPLSPADADSPSQGASQIRGIKLYLTDVFGAPNNSAVTAAPMSFTSGGVLSILQSPLTVPTLLQGTASQVLRIGAQYSNLSFEVNGASVMAVNATGLLMQTPWVEWSSGTTGFLGTRGSQSLALRTNAANRVTVDSGGNVGIGTSTPTSLLHIAGTSYANTLDGSTLNVRGVGPHALGGVTDNLLQLALRGAFTGGSIGTVVSLDIGTTLRTSGQPRPMYGILVHPAFSEFDSFGTHSSLAGIVVQPTVIGGTATTDTLAGIIIPSFVAASGTTTAAGIWVTAPTGATNNYTLWLQGGSFRLDTNAILTNNGAATVTLPSATDTLIGRDTTDTLTNKTLTTPTIASFTNSTHTHQNAAGGGTLDAAAIAAGTVATARLGSGSATSSTFLRGDGTWSAQDFTPTFESADQTVTLSTILTVAHGIGSKPRHVEVTLKNVTADLNYSTGDEVHALAFGLDGAQAGRVYFAWDSTNVIIFQGGRFLVPNKTTGAITDPTTANWKWVVRAWK